MSQNNVKITWKAIVAIMLVMATIIAMSALVSAEFMEAFLVDDEYELMAASSSPGSPPSSITGWSDHAITRMGEHGMGQDYLEFIYSDASPTWNSQHGTWNYTDGTATICVNPSGVVTTVYWNYEL